MMQAISPEITELIYSASAHDLNGGDGLFLLLDGARLPEMPRWLASNVTEENWVSLLGATAGSPLLAASPVLVSLTPDISHRPFVRRLFKLFEHRRAASVIVSSIELKALAQHLGDRMYVLDPDRTKWALAIWDPYVLAALVGLRPALSALVPGPILFTEQIAGLLEPISRWYFIGPEGMPCSMAASSGAPDTVSTEPLLLTQKQMNQLADIPLPDLVLKTLNRVCPEITNRNSAVSLHATACAAIVESRRNGRDDLASYCEVAYEKFMEINVARTIDPTVQSQRSGDIDVRTP